MDLTFIANGFILSQVFAYTWSYIRRLYTSHYGLNPLIWFYIINVASLKYSTGLLGVKTRWGACRRFCPWFNEMIENNPLWCHEGLLSKWKYLYTFLRSRHLTITCSKSSYFRSIWVSSMYLHHSWWRATVVNRTSNSYPNTQEISADKALAPRIAIWDHRKLK